MASRSGERAAADSTEWDKHARKGPVEERLRHSAMCWGNVGDKPDAATFFGENENSEFHDRRRCILADLANLARQRDRASLSELVLDREHLAILGKIRTRL